MSLRPTPRAGLLALTILAFCSCHSPSPAPAPAPAPAAAAAAQAPPSPQFTFASWKQVQPLIRGGRVLGVVTGRGGTSLILDNHLWVHIVAKPGDPLPRNPLDEITRSAPNASSIRFTKD